MVEGGCNECSNCEVYCPEQGAPFVVKERLFASREAFVTEAGLDGFCREDGILHARLGGVEMRFTPEIERNRASVTGDHFHLELSWEPFAVVKGHLTGPETGLDTALLWRIRTAWDAIYGSTLANMVNA